MDESEDNLSSDDRNSINSPRNAKTKPKKRSLIERELETNLTARITSPVINEDGTNTSRYGRARRLKSNMEQSDIKKVTHEIKSPLSEKSPMKTITQSPVYKMHASNSPVKITVSPKKQIEKFLDNQIESIYQENISLSRFGSEEDTVVIPSPVKKFPKVYIRKDLIQKKEPEDTVLVIQNMFSPVKSTKKSTNTHLNNIFERSCERYSLNSKQQNGYIDNSAVVKTLDFDSKKKKIATKDNRNVMSKSELFEMEAKCPYQVGDLAWARMGTYPFWPSIVTRDPSSGTFVKKKLFGRIEHDVIHVTFFGDNGRRSWIVDNMLRKYLGQLEFESTRNSFSPEDKKKDPRLYAAYFVSEKKQALWNKSVEEAEILLREPKRLRIDIFNDMLLKSRSGKVKQPKSKVSRTNSDVSLSESLYDSLFSEEDGKSDVGSGDRSRNRSRNKSLDMFEVVTACLDNMAAKTGISKIQKQSHMDRWLQKAKSKTPEKTKAQTEAPLKFEDIKEIKVNKKKSTATNNEIHKGYCLRKKAGSKNLLSHQNEHDYSLKIQLTDIETDSEKTLADANDNQLFTKESSELGVIIKVESLVEKTNDNLANTIIESSVDMNATCESETFTDVSEDLNDVISSRNNNIIDEAESKTLNDSLVSKDQLKSENQRGCFKLGNDKNDGQGSTIFKNSKGEVEVNNIIIQNKEIQNSREVASSRMSGDNVDSQSDNSNDLRKSYESQHLDNPLINLKMPIEDQGSEIQDSNNLDSEKVTSSRMSVDYDDLQSENSKDLKNSYENQDTDQIQHNIAYLKPEKAYDTKATHDTNFQNVLKDVANPYSIHQVTSDLLEISNLASNSSDQNVCTESDDIRPNNTDMQNENVIININHIDSNIQDMSNVKEDKVIIGSTTSKSIEKFFAIIQEHTMNKAIHEIEQNELEDASDDDSDSERLPYSPLSNLGNNSDDNLSLDDVPILNDNVTKLETLDEDIVNKEKLYKTSNMVANDAKIEKYKLDDGISNDESMDIQYNNSITGVQETKNDKESKKENIDKKLKEYIECEQDIINNYEKEVSVTDKKSQDPIEKITANNYRAKNTKEIDIAVEVKESENYVQSNKEHIDNKLKENIEIEQDHICDYEKEVSVTDKKLKDAMEHRRKSYRGNYIKEIDMVTEVEEINNVSHSKKENVDNKLKEHVVFERHHMQNHEKEVSVTVENPKDPMENITGNDYSRENIKEIDAVTEVEKTKNNSQGKKKNIDNESKENVEFKQYHINHYEKEVSVTDERLKNHMKNTTENGYREENGEKNDMVTVVEEINNDSQSKNESVDNKSKENVEFEVDHEKEVSVTNEKLKDPIENITANGYRENHIKEIDMLAKEVSIYVSNSTTAATQKTSSYHINETSDVNTTSIHSDTYSAVPTNIDSKHNFSKGNKKRLDVLENPDFVKYMELRQDVLLDENPELTENEIVAYLYKTWLYEESAKSDVKKNDDLRECNIVKGLSKPCVTPLPRKKNLSLSKSQSKVNSGNLKMFLRRKKNIEKTLEDDKLDLNTNKNVTKNMSKDDGDSSRISKEEWHIFPFKEYKNISSGSEINKEVIEYESLCNESVNSKSAEVIGDSSAIIEKNKSLSESSTTFEERLTSIKEQVTLKDDLDGDSIDSEDSEAPLIRCQLRTKLKKESDTQECSADNKIKVEDIDIISIHSEDSEVSTSKGRKKYGNKKQENALEDPEFVKYLELRQDALIDENPDLTQDEIVAYLYQTWLYEENIKPEIKKNDEIEQSTMVKGLQEPVQQPKKIRRKIPKTEKTEKDVIEHESPTKDKPKRKSVKPFYNEEYSDIEDELEVFEIFKPKKPEHPKSEGEPVTQSDQVSNEVEVYDEVELYFAELTKPKPNIFKGLIREKVCEICEKIGNLVKCKGCHCMFHVDCLKKQTEVVEVSTPNRGRKKKKKQGRKPKNSDELENEHDLSEENNASIEEILETEPHTVDADVLEAQLSAKMKEILDCEEKIEYDSYSSDECLDWNETVPGKCEIIDVKLKPRLSLSEMDYSDFKCNNCQKYNTPICFVCKDAVSSKNSTKRQKCHVQHCNKYYHLDCLDHWPQTQFNGGEPSKNPKKFIEHFEAFTCPRHVCHTCVSDDPRGCKTRFSGDKLARCLKCPATYHSFTKCLPAGSKVLTASHIICPRHYEHRAGKAPCHVNTGWCFICALGGSLICCEYCPTSFHAECLNIDPPEGGYMCEDCETGRLPLYGEMVWVKLGHYRWWPAIILHPYEIPENILAVKHSPGEFVVRFFGQYDHYWVNRGRVFPFQEGDSGRVSSQKSKIDAAFTCAVDHAQRACEILKTALPNEEETLDIASSLLPPHYVKLKVNKPCGSLCSWKLEDPESSLTQCECNPHEEDPCGPYSQCLNRMLLTECGPICRAGDRCNNRAFEKRLYPKLVPYMTPSRGWGLKTLEDIKAGQFVIEYVGELIDEEEFRRRMRRKHEMRDENFYFLTLDKERMIDAGPKGNLARFMNHCCEPNCETQKWTVLGDVRVGLFALYDIPAHSEVTFNYNLECAGIDKKRCMCGAKRCSGYIGAKPKQDESQSKKNKMQPGKRTYKKRKPEESPSTKNKVKRPLGRPPKPKELTEIEKDLLIIKSATNELSMEENNSSSSEQEKNPKSLKRKRESFTSEEIVNDGMDSPDVKKVKLEEKLEGD